MPSWTSPSVSSRILPISRVIASAISRFRAVMRSPTLRSASPRCGAGTFRHAANPRFADSTAFSTSSGPDDGKRPSTSSHRAGLRFSLYSPVEGSTHSPAM